MVFGQWRIVHFQCDERIGVGCLLERNAANKRGHFARNFVQPAKHDVFAGVLHAGTLRSEEHTSELQSRLHLVCRLLLEKKKKNQNTVIRSNVELTATQLKLN